MDAREEREKRLKRLKKKRAVSVAVFCLILVGIGIGYVAARQYRIKKETQKADEQNQQEQTEEIPITSFTLADATGVELKNEYGEFRFDWVYTDEEKHIGGWVRAGEEDFPTKPTAVQGFISCVSLLTGKLKIPAEEVDLEKFGLADAKIHLKVFLKDNTEPSFTIGAQAPYETGYYLRVDETGDVYLVENAVYNKCNLTVIDMIQIEMFPKAEVSNITKVIIEEKGKEPVSYERTINADGSSAYPPFFTNCTSFIINTAQEYNCKDFSVYGLTEPESRVSVYYNDVTTSEGGEEDVVPMLMYVEIGDKTESGNYYVRINGTNYVYIMTEACVEILFPD